VRILVTSALPYANGDVHFGQVAGAYLPADIFVKYHRLKGSDVVYMCGSDEHGVPITLAAQKQGLSPKEIVDKYHVRIRKAFEDFGIEFDNYSRTSLPLHHKTSRDFFTKVYDKGLITPRTTRQLYCPSCNMFLADRYVEGTCPNCGSEDARGDQCEACGRWIEPLDLIEPRLRDRSITRDLSWGVPVPLAEARGKVMYVWFDAPIGYVSSTMEWAEQQSKPDRWRDYWEDPNTRLVHFIGKDNIVFHAMVWPAMLMAHGEWVLPTDIPANEFLNIESRKFSTSRDWALWLPEYLAEFPADPLRYALAVNLPENRDVDFAWRDFHARNNNELADVLGNFVNRVAVFLNKNYGGRVPDVTADDEAGLEVLKKIEAAPGRLGEMIDTYRLKDAAREVMTLPALGNRYFDKQSPWRSVKDNRAECDRTLATCVRLVSALEVLLYPFLPFTSRKIGNMLGLGRRKWDDAGNPVVPSQLGPVEILFRKLDDSFVATQVAKLGGEPKESQEPAEAGGKPEETKMITFDEFKQIQLKTGRIVSAERVPDTDKLIRIMVDLGGEQRQVVAGIGKAYEPDALVGKTVVVVAVECHS
jgi:methionyl-tRNA synthetase